jgi:DNA-binding transcriptional ArsR family regulator
MSNESTSSIRPHRVVDLESLKALAHPLRVRIIDTLSTYGSFTASGLAERLGESSGSMSYHLRQLEKHDFIREVDGKGTGRERWWERTPGAIELTSKDVQASEAGRQATRLVVREFGILKENALADFIETADSLPEEWSEASAISTAHAFVTADELKEFNEHIFTLIRDFAEARRGKQPPGTRPIEFHYNSFPVVGGSETPVDDLASHSVNASPTTSVTASVTKGKVR